MTTGRFMDDSGSRYGWICAIVVNLLAMAFFFGGLNQQVGDMRRDIDILKSQVYDLSHITRGDGDTELDYQARKRQALK